jgi:hemerythrin-like metal-binding protein
MLLTGHKPKWLYETMPYVYIVAGFATAGMLQNAVATVSGMLLLSAGALVLTMRHTYRANHQAPEAAPVAESIERNSGQGAEILQVAWRPSFEVGHDVIDRQHQRLLSLGNELVTAVMQQRPREDVELMLEVLVTEIGEHLKAEDEITGGHSTPLPRKTTEAHRGLLARGNALRDRLLEGQFPAGDLVGFVAYDLIILHIVKEDLRLRLGTRGRKAAHALLQGERELAA